MKYITVLDFEVSRIFQYKLGEFGVSVLVKLILTISGELIMF